MISLDLLLKMFIFKLRVGDSVGDKIKFRSKLLGKSL